MVLYPGQLLDEARHTRKRPQVGFVTSAYRAGDKCIHDRVGLSCSKLGLAACLSLAGQARLAAFLPCRLPSVSHLAAHPQPPTHLRGRDPPGKHRSSPNPPLFHPCVISRQSHARIVRCHRYLVTLLCESQYLGFWRENDPRTMDDRGVLMGAIDRQVAPSAPSSSAACGFVAGASDTTVAPSRCGTG